MKKIIKIPVTFLLTFSLMSGVTVFSGIESPLYDEENLSVLNEDFVALPENELEEITSNSNDYDVYVLMQFDYPSIDIATLEGLSVEERRDTVKNYYKTKNEQIASELGLSGISVSYSAPYAEITYDSISEYNNERNNLISAAADNDIKYVGADLISTEKSFTESSEANTAATAPDFTLDSVFEEIGVSEETDYNGSGIKVGILEGYLPTPCANLPSTVNIEKYGSSNQTLNWHTAFVASLIGGTTGISRGSSFYFAAFHTADSHDANYTLTKCLNWLLNTKYVNIINMSAPYYFINEYYTTSTGQPSLGTIINSTVYTNFCAYIDHVIATSGCLLVKSAGNTGGNLTKPGMAINALTVGATNANGEVWEDSSYISTDENIPKPEVVAPGVNIVMPNIGTKSGTSFAAPLATGIAVRLMHQYPDLLKTNPSLLKEVIMGGCNRLDNVDQIFDEYSGFGIINYAASRRIIENKRFGTVTTPEYSSAGQVVYESLISVNPMPMQFIYINLSRLIPGKNCTPNTDITEPGMVKYQVRIIEEVSGGEKILYETDWDTSVAYISTEIRAVILRTYKIQIITKEKVRNKPEIISLSHPNINHVHSYTSHYSPVDNHRHLAECACKDFTYELHTYPEGQTGTRICTKCNYPEGYLPN